MNMKQNTSECFQALRANLALDKRRVELLATFLIALIQQNTCNLARLANVLDLSAKKESKYRRLKRFVQNVPLGWDGLASLIVKIVAPRGKYLLALDRTEWRYGAIWVNIVTLSIISGNSSIPLFWETLNRKGNTTLEERKEILRRYLKVFGAASIAYLSCDREFDSPEFIRFLDKEKIGFRMRVRVSMKITNRRTKQTCLFSEVLSKMAVGQFSKWRKARNYGTVKVYVEIEKGETSAECVIVLSSEKSRSILIDYKQRWKIETLFQNLKGRGFEIEETHLQKAEKIDRLFGVLALAVAWAIKTGELESNFEPIEIKKNGRPQQSYFRLGCEIIQQFLMEVKSYSKVNLIEILRC